MGSRYLFIVLYVWLEKYLSRGDYHRSKSRVGLKQNAEQVLVLGGAGFIGSSLAIGLKNSILNGKLFV
jgi:hypothetical protein